MIDVFNRTRTITFTGSTAGPGGTDPVAVDFQIQNGKLEGYSIQLLEGNATLIEGRFFTSTKTDDTYDFNASPPAAYTTVEQRRRISDLSSTALTQSSTAVSLDSAIATPKPFAGGLGGAFTVTTPNDTTEQVLLITVWGTVGR